MGEGDQVREHQAGVISRLGHSINSVPRMAGSPASYLGGSYRCLFRANRTLEPARYQGRFWTRPGHRSVDSAPTAATRIKND